MTDHRIRSATIGFFLLLIFFIKAIWHGLVFLFSLIDSDDEPESNSLPNNYNYRTGKTDLTRLRSGIYDDEP